MDSAIGVMPVKITWDGTGGTQTLWAVQSEFTAGRHEEKRRSALKGNWLSRQSGWKKKKN